MEEYPPRRRNRDDDLVDVSMSGPKGICGFQTKVSRKSADMMATTFLGGLLVVIGVIVCAIFGIRPPKPKA